MARGFSNALRIALGGVAGGLEGYGEKQERLGKASLLKQQQERQAEQDAINLAKSLVDMGFRPDFGEDDAIASSMPIPRQSTRLDTTLPTFGAGLAPAMERTRRESFGITPERPVAQPKPLVSALTQAEQVQPPRPRTGDKTLNVPGIGSMRMKRPETDEEKLASKLKEYEGQQEVLDRREAIRQGRLTDEVKRKEREDNLGIYSVLTSQVNPDTGKPFIDPSIPFDQIPPQKLKYAFDLAKQRLGADQSMSRVLATIAARDASRDDRQDQAARTAYNRNLIGQATNYRTTTKEFRTKAEGATSLIDALSKKNAVFDQAAMDSFIRAITGKSPVNAQYATTQALGSIPDKFRQSFERAMKGDILPQKVRNDMLEYVKTVVESGEEELAPYQQNVGAQLRGQADFMNVQPNVSADSATAAPNYFGAARAKLNRLSGPQASPASALFPTTPIRSALDSASNPAAAALAKIRGQKR